MLKGFLGVIWLGKVDCVVGLKNLVKIDEIRMAKGSCEIDLAEKCILSTISLLKFGLGETFQSEELEGFLILGDICR